MANFEPKLTKEQKKEIFNRCLKGESNTALAKEFGIDKSMVTRIKYDKKLLDVADKKLTARQQFARLQIHACAEKGIEKEREILNRDVPEGKEGTSLLYLQHQVSVDMMNRSGLKAQDKDTSGVTVVFSNGGGFEPGMPTEMSEEDEAE